MSAYPVMLDGSKFAALIVGGARFDTRYGLAVVELRRLRDRLLATGERDQRKSLAQELLGECFSSDVESGAIVSRVCAWR